MRPLLFSLLSLFTSPAWSVASIQSSGLTPDNALPGDLVEAIFRVDGGTPPGNAGVWVDNIQQCAARVQDGFFRCAFTVPHGGRFAYELRYRTVANSETRLLQTALSGGLRIVKIQPQIPQAGRSALIFAKLDYFNPAAVPQPQGQIEIVSEDLTQRCIALSSN